MLLMYYTAQKFKYKSFSLSISSVTGQIRSFLRIWSHLLKKSLMENFIFCAGLLVRFYALIPGCVEVKS